MLKQVNKYNFHNFYQIFIENSPQLFIAQVEKDPKIIDAVFDCSKQKEQKIQEKASELFFKSHSSMELNHISMQIISVFENLNYTMTSLKNKYLDQSQ